MSARWSRSRALARILAGLLAGAMTLGAQAQEDSPIRLSGFLSIVGGRVFGSSSQDPLESKPEFDCPCYVADWAHAGIYGTKFTLKPESRVGVQADIAFTPKLDLTAQLVSRGTQLRPELEWAYFTYRIDGQWDIQAGRKRLPLYYYSVSQDIGFSYPWISPPPELYGWEVTNFNGASLRYRGNAAGTNLTGSVFAGEESVKKAQYFTTFETEDFDVKWKNILGGDLEFTGEWWTARLIYLQSKNTLSGPETIETSQHKMKAYGAAFNADFGPWFLLSEVGENQRNYDSGYDIKSTSLSAGAGYRAGKWTPFLNYAYYRDRTDIPDYGPSQWWRWSATLRYDLGATSALTVQLDRQTSKTTDVSGDANVIRVGYDLVF